MIGESPWFSGLTTGVFIVTGGVLATIPELIDQLYRETSFYSGPAEREPSYQALAALGYEAVPDLIRSLELRPCFQVLTLVNKAVPKEDWPLFDPSDAGRIGIVSEKWVIWAIGKNIL